MKKTFAFAALLGPVLLAGCETTVDLPEPPHTPRVALLYTLTTAPQDSAYKELFEQRRLYVSNSEHVFAADDPVGRADARVELRDAAGAVVERYQAMPPGSTYYGVNGFYRPTLGFQPRPGQTYTLRTALPNLETAESTLTLPAEATIESATYVARPVDPTRDPGRFEGRLSLTLRDDPAQANYYMAYARVLDQQGQPGNWSPVEVNYNDQDNVATIGQFQLSSPRQQYSLYPYADTDVNGQRVSLATDVVFTNYDCYQGNCQPPGYLEVVVSSITADAYNFYLARRRYYDSSGNPFAEPARLPSNVRPGYGLFGGATDVTYRIKVF